jgi:hypothetical protein
MTLVDFGGCNSRGDSLFLDETQIEN